MLHFHADNIPMPAIDFPKVEQWIKSTAAQYGYSVGELNYIFCNDEAKVRKLVLRGKRPSVKYMLITVPCIA